MPDQDDPQDRLQRALIAIAWSDFQYFAGQAQASLESARSALEWLPADKVYVASMALFFLALAGQLNGQEEMALAALQQALRELSARPTITARLLFAQALAYLAVGKLLQVEQLARHLLQVAQDADLALSHAWSHWFLGMVYYEWNRLDEVVYHFSAVIANQHRAPFWVVQDALCVLALAYHTLGLDKEAQEASQTLLDWVQEQHNLSQLQTAYVFCGHLALVQDQVQQAEHWLELAGEHEVAGPMLCLEEPVIIRAWLLVARGDAASVAEGQALLTTLLEHAEAIHSTRKAIQVLALQAWAYDLQGQAAHALDVLERALVLAHPGGFLRTFADLPPLATLLQELRKRRKAQQKVDKPLDTYLHRILGAMHPTPAHPTSTEALLQQEGLEPLTGRELHVLRLLHQDKNNKEIALELVVTPGTVKVHTNNLYRKLGVNNRRAAVTLAKALGLLA